MIGLIFAYSASGSSQITSVRLICTDLCQQSNPAAPKPFDERLYEAEAETAVFKKAMDNAEEMLGEVDYGVYFTMHLTYKDGTQKEYVLNIDRERGKGYEGLLVADVGQYSKAYSIPAKYHDELNELIYE
ncbi:hypothetical protein [Paenibacillus sp. PK3_47]|uniref:hypothetical protein n=1 Tax=Paenibacillus sp. PK3_47 TaxID=2072642 RepID=UPI00201D5D6D|nr:hypothetical protein [Paenibacillus sp. PK3_47]